MHYSIKPHLFKWFSFYALLLMLPSCATLFSTKHQKIHVDSDKKQTQVAVYPDTTRWVQTPVLLKVKRAKKDIVILLKTDSLQNRIAVKPKLSGTYLVVNYFTPMYAGYFIDLLNEKRFVYPRYILLPSDTVRRGKNSKPFETLKPTTKGMVNIKLAMPQINYFYHRQGVNRYGQSFGYLGLSGGIEYFLTNDVTLNMDVGAIIDYIGSTPAFTLREHTYSKSLANYIDLQVGRRYRKFQFDAGVQFTKTYYFERKVIDLGSDRFVDSISIVNGQNCLGFAFSTYYKLNNIFSVGFNYYPSVFTWQRRDAQFRYSHLLFVELLFTIQTYTPNRKKVNRY